MIVLPCPFCGETPTVDSTERHRHDGSSSDEWLVCCLTAWCYGNAYTLDGTFHTRAHACEAWNRRATISEAVAQQEVDHLRAEVVRLEEALFQSLERLANLPCPQTPTTASSHPPGPMASADTATRMPSP